MWQPINGFGLERCKAITRSKLRILHGDVIYARNDTQSYLIHYEVICDWTWRIQSFQLDLNGESAIDWFLDNKGHWTSRTGEPLDEFDNCLYLDLSVTPSTNTLAVEYIPFIAGESKEVDAVYVDFDTSPFPKISRVRQRYTSLGQRGEYWYYRYENLDSGFTTELLFDDFRLVVDYPDHYKRVWQRQLV
jgi:uncharacterized protein